MFGGNMSDEDHQSARFIAQPDFDGPTKNRHCTDILCLILIGIHWIALTGIGIYAINNGDYRLVLHPVDYDGNVCGTDYAANMTEYPNLYYINSFAGGVCVKECPDLTNKTSDSLTDIHTLITYNGTWQVDGSELSNDFISIADYSQSNDTKQCTEFLCYPNNDITQSWTSLGIMQSYGFAYYAASTYNVLNRCYITSQAEERILELVQANTSTININIDSNKYVDQLYDFWNRLFADIFIARYYIFGFGFGVSLCISLFYIYLFRFPGILATVIWSSIGATITLFAVGGYYAYNQARIWNTSIPQTVDDQSIYVTTIVSYVLWIIAVLVAILACCLRQSIGDAILCTRQAGKAVNSMIMILFVPIIQTIGLLLYMIPFMIYAINLASLGTITTTEVPLIGDLPAGAGASVTMRSFEYDTFVERCGWFLLFSLFWTGNFIVAVGDMIIAVSVAKWYFTRNKLLIGSWTVLFSIFEVIFYHTGTCAFGSLLVAIIQLIRTIIARAQKKAKEAGSTIAQILLCCCQCFFWCLECCLKYVNKNAYIQTAIFSTSFCISCKESFGLIFRNAGRIAAVSYVSAAVLIIGKLFISSAVTILSYYTITTYLKDSVSSVAGPVAITFLLSYFVSDMFMDVLDIGMLTVLHCFIADEEMFEDGERYYDSDLKGYVDKHGGHEEYHSETNNSNSNNNNVGRSHVEEADGTKNKNNYTEDE